jgi:hypothetical protein
MLVGEHHLVGVVQQRGHAQDRRVHRGDRDVAVERALAVVLEQQRRQLALDVEQRQPGALGAGRISGAEPIQLTVCAMPARRRASMLTSESLPPPIATSACVDRPSVGAGPGASSPSPERNCSLPRSCRWLR